ncbi:response regulator [Elusimicrobiota bacterium]
MSDALIKILIVDDESTIRLMVRTYLNPYNVEVIETKDGYKALEIMKEQEIDIAIIDYSMPLLSGQEIINAMSEDEKMSSISVIVYTSGGFKKEIEDSLKQSSMAYVEKINLGHDLIPAIQDIMGERFKKL